MYAHVFVCINFEEQDLDKKVRFQKDIRIDGNDNMCFFDGVCNGENGNCGLGYFFLKIIVLNSKQIVEGVQITKLSAWH